MHTNMRCGNRQTRALTPHPDKHNLCNTPQSMRASYPVDGLLPHSAASAASRWSEVGGSVEPRGKCSAMRSIQTCWREAGRYGRGRGLVSSSRLAFWRSQKRAMRAMACASSCRQATAIEAGELAAKQAGCATMHPPAHPARGGF